jgi:hypothetical protein
VGKPPSFQGLEQRGQRPRWECLAYPNKRFKLGLPSPPCETVSCAPPKDDRTRDSDPISREDPRGTRKGSVQLHSLALQLL